MRPGDAIAIAYRPDKQMLYRSATQKPYRLAGAPLRGIRGSVCSAWPINWSRDRTCRAGAIVTLTRRIGGRPNTERAGQVPLPACSQRPASMRGFFCRRSVNWHGLAPGGQSANRFGTRATGGPSLHSCVVPRQTAPACVRSLHAGHPANGMRTLHSNTHTRY